MPGPNMSPPPSTNPDYWKSTRRSTAFALALLGTFVSASIVNAQLSGDGIGLSTTSAWTSAVFDALAALLAAFALLKNSNPRPATRLLLAAATSFPLSYLALIA